MQVMREHAGKMEDMIALGIEPGPVALDVNNYLIVNNKSTNTINK